MLDKVQVTLVVGGSIQVTCGPAGGWTQSK